MDDVQVVAEVTTCCSGDGWKNGHMKVLRALGVFIEEVDSDLDAAINDPI